MRFLVLTILVLFSSISFAAVDLEESRISLPQDTTTIHCYFQAERRVGYYSNKVEVFLNSYGKYHIYVKRTGADYFKKKLLASCEHIRVGPDSEFRSQ